MANEPDKPVALDRKRFVREAKRAAKVRAGRSVGGETTGAVRIVRENLEAIRSLRADGVAWAGIAEALAAQGVHQIVDGEKRPITAKRLTSLVSTIEARERRRQEEQALREARPDLIRLPTDVAEPSPRKIGLAPEMQRDPDRSRDSGAASHKDRFETEEEMRLRRLREVEKYRKDRRT